MSIHFISCDWGTTSFRLRLAAWPDGRILAELACDRGVKVLHDRLATEGTRSPVERAKAFETFLRSQLGRLDLSVCPGEHDLPVLISGMASSSVGWKELPYARTPFALDGSGVRYEAIGSGERFVAYLISGVRTNRDVMRGEECEVLGLVFQGVLGDADRDTTLILPGTHSKHIRLQGEAMTGFQTHMTGELFELLSTRSLLSNSVSALRGFSDGASGERERTAFIAGVRTAHEEGVSVSLFRVRTRAILQRVDAGANGWFLSGLLIGGELTGLCRGESNSSIVLAAPGKLSQAYRIAFESLGAGDRLTVVPPEDAERASVLGHTRLLQQLLSRR